MTEERPRATDDRPDRGERPAAAVERAVRSPARVRILRAAAGGPVTAGALADRLDVCRRTVVRNLNALTEDGWLTAGPDGHRLTPPGELFAGGLFDALADAGTALELRPFYDEFPPDVDLPASALTDATVTVAEPHTPLRPVERVLDLIGEADHLRTIAPVMTERYNEAYADAIASGSRVETVLTPAVLSALRASMPDLDAALAPDRVTVRVATDPPGFGLLLVDGTAAVGAYDAGSLRALAESDAPAAVDWAESTFERRRDRAVPLSGHAGD